MRAFTIRVDATSGVSGFLRPSDRVDVYWSGRSEIGEVTQLIEAGVRIIAIDQSADEDRVAPTDRAHGDGAGSTRNRPPGSRRPRPPASSRCRSSSRRSSRSRKNVTINQRQLLGITGPAAVEAAQGVFGPDKARHGIRQHPDRVPDRIDTDMSRKSEARAHTMWGAFFF